MHFFTPLEGSIETPIGRCAKALLYGAVVGTGISCLPFLISPTTLIFAIPAIFFSWLQGLLVVGVPGWALLHALKLRGKGVAILFGALTASSPVIGMIALSGGRNSPYTDGPIIPLYGVLLAFAGGVSGLVIWRKAYLGRVFAKGGKEKGGTVSDPALPILSR